VTIVFLNKSSFFYFHIILVSSPSSLCLLQVN